jgi:hypothetical protein
VTDPVLPTSFGIRQLTGTGARVLIWLYFATMLALALWTLDDVRSPAPTIAGLMLFAAACLALSFDSAPRLSLGVTTLVCGVSVANALLISWQLMAGGHSQWYFGAGTVMMFYLCLRGRIVFAWIGFLAMSLVIVAWGLTTSVGLAEALVLIGRQAPIVLVGTLFATGMRRTAKAIDRLRVETSMRATTTAAAEATAREREARLGALDEVVTPLLEKLVDGSEILPQSRVEFAIAAAELRDGLRARSLSTPRVLEAARDARRLGIEVTLLDDSDPSTLTPDDLERAESATVETLRAARDGQVTARLLPPGRENIATVVAHGTEHTSIEVTRTD